MNLLAEANSLRKKCTSGKIIVTSLLGLAFWGMFNKPIVDFTKPAPNFNNNFPTPVSNSWEYKSPGSFRLPPNATPMPTRIPPSGE